MHIEIVNLQIIKPDVNMKAQQTAAKYRKKMCKLKLLTSPVKHPKIICVIIPISMT